MDISPFCAGCSSGENGAHDGQCLFAQSLPKHQDLPDLSLSSDKLSEINLLGVRLVDQPDQSQDAVLTEYMSNLMVNLDSPKRDPGHDPSQFPPRSITQDPLSPLWFNPYSNLSKLTGQIQASQLCYPQTLAIAQFMDEPNTNIFPDIIDGYNSEMDQVESYDEDNYSLTNLSSVLQRPASDLFPGSESLQIKRRNVIDRLGKDEEVSTSDIRLCSKIKGILCNEPANSGSVGKCRLINIRRQSSSSTGQATNMECAVVGCTMKFSRPDRFKTHLCRHAGIRNLRCGGRCRDPHCEWSFFSKSDLRSHIEKRDAVRVCDICADPYTLKNYKRHLQSIKCRNSLRSCSN